MGALDAAGGAGDNCCMNYFAHGCAFIDRPYLLAGTAVPDWVRVSDPGLRVRSRHAEPLVGVADPVLAQVAQGVVQHHRDDGWFHGTAAFSTASWALTKLFRDVLVADEGFRPSFLGHILVEMLLDDLLIADDPSRLEAFYSAFDQVDPDRLAWAVGQIATRPVVGLARWVPLFSRERFLSDYADDGKLVVRLNQIMRRVKLPELPGQFAQVLPAARSVVALHRRGLLEGAGQSLAFLCRG